MNPVITAIKSVGRLIADTIRDVLDEVYTDDGNAASFLGCGRDYFIQNYKKQCGVKQGSYMTYRKSDLLQRREQLRKETADDRTDV